MSRPHSSPVSRKDRRLARALAALLAAVGCIAAVACRPADRGSAIDRLLTSTPPGVDIILILSDTHRLDHVTGFPGARTGLTPNISALMADAVAFTNVSTPVPISAPAYASLMTGLSPIEHGVLNNQQHLVTDLPLLQEVLRQAGYRTAAVVGNPFCSAGHGFGRGFDFYWDRVDGRGKEGEIITDEAIRWLDGAAGDGPVFLFLAYMDAHTPYISDEVPPSLRVELNGVWLRDERAENAHVEQRYPLDLQPGPNRIALSFLGDGPDAPPGEPSPLHVKGLAMASGRELRRSSGVEPIAGTTFERLANRALLDVVNPGPGTVRDELVFRCHRVYRPARIPELYAAGVRSFDRAVGRLLDHLRRLGRFDDSVVIFVSDHGEMLGEHNAWGHVDHLYEASLRVPLVIRAPDVEGRHRDATRFDLQDLHDLILDLATGADAERARRRERRRLAPLVAATYPPEAACLAASAARDGLKVIVGADGSERVYDLLADPGEEVDLSSLRNEDPAVLELLTAARHQLAAAAGAELLDPASLSDDERDRLHALGYLDAAR